MIKFDADFLQDNNFLDYSLLLFCIYDYGLNGQGFQDYPGREENLPSPNSMSSFVQSLVDE